ncbi:hypothetical protein PHYPSEUDO_013881 [Phytophthora pseudosyringae]|uniref:Uncharacterized protein n=1 Tax=Phytophthora pseudosyringae TaxID=221518 RepID=A0A8T1W2T5_9STRA|nr:hypothetical protein PHYPSEUDO_013881 [Phytophthora pseudosyringae]
MGKCCYPTTTESSQVAFGRAASTRRQAPSLGLCNAEFSLHEIVLNTVPMANRLTTLDLSFALTGIPGAHVVAASLRKAGCAILTQLQTRSRAGRRSIRTTAAEDREWAAQLELGSGGESEAVGHQSLSSVLVRSASCCSVLRTPSSCTKVFTQDIVAIPHHAHVCIESTKCVAHRLAPVPLCPKATRPSAPAAQHPTSPFTNSSANEDHATNRIVLKGSESELGVATDSVSCRGRFMPLDNGSRRLRDPGDFFQEPHLPSRRLSIAHARREETPGIIPSLSEADGEGEPVPPFHLPQSVEDGDGVAGTALSQRSLLRSQSPSAPQQLQLQEDEGEQSPVAKDIPPPMEEDIPPPSADMPPSVLPIRQDSAPKVESVSWTLTAGMDPILPTKTPPKLGAPGAAQPSKRRITYAVDEVSHHALDRLGVNADILKKEKGMKKLGICDVDITRSEELRRYTGISQAEPTSKVEFMFGFNDEQLHRDKAIKRLGTSEQEIMDDYSRRVSRLGVSNSHPVQP